MKRVNVFDDAILAPDDDEPGGYRAPYAKVQRHVPAQRLGGTIVALGPGQALCPYHYEVVEEEWLIVLSGTPTVRTAAGDEVVGPWDVVCFPRGEPGAHRIANDSSEPARVLMVSERAELGAAVYPDSDKIGIFGAGLRSLFRRTDERDYWDGEPANAPG